VVLSSVGAGFSARYLMDALQEIEYKNSETDILDSSHFPLRHMAWALELNLNKFSKKPESSMEKE
jgi:hypothetical protein